MATRSAAGSPAQLRGSSSMTLAIDNHDFVAVGLLMG